VLFLSAFLSGNINAQKTSLQIIDEENLIPIPNVHYIYGEQKGLSDEGGKIHLEINNIDDLTLSHISYGQWTLLAKDLKEIIHTGLIYRNKEYKSLYPVNIVEIEHHVINKEEINLESTHKLAHDGGSLLSNIPSINGIRKSASYSYDPVLRGFKYDQINIVIDGAISATAACPNRMDPPTSQVVPNMTERVEIIKGPHALRFGSSFGGAINYVSTKGNFSKKPKLFGRLTSSYESNGGIIRSEAMAGFKNKFSYSAIFGSFTQGNDYVDGNNMEVQADFGRVNLGFLSKLKLNNRNLLDIQLNHNNATLSEFPSLPMDLRSDKTWLGKLKHTKILNDHNQIKTSIYGSFVDHEMDNYEKVFDIRKVDAITYASTVNLGGRSELELINESKIFYLGVDFHLESAEGTRERTFLTGPNVGSSAMDDVWQDSNIGRAGIFTQISRKYKSIDVIFAARVNYNNAQTNSPDNDFRTIYVNVDSEQVNLSLSTGLTKQFSKSFNFGVWLGRAQRSGSLTERYINYFPVGLDPYEIVGNPEIRPETNNQIDVSFKFNTESSNIQLDLFASLVQNYISSVIAPDLSPRMSTSPGVRQVLNLDNATLYGGEFTYRQRIGKTLDYQLDLAYTIGQDMKTSDPLPEIAPLDISLRIFGHYLKNKLNPEVRFRYVAKQDRISEEFGELATPSFSLLDAKINYKISKILSTSIGVNNILDQAYYEHLSRAIKGTNTPIYAPGRSAFVSLIISF
jgi:iron complex outermembrane receptor protein